MGQYADIDRIRFAAYHFSGSANELRQREKRLEQLNDNIVNSPKGWVGEGAESYLARAKYIQKDLITASDAFDRTSQTLLALAAQLEQVNTLRRQAELLQEEIQVLQQRSWGADDVQRVTLERQISHLSHRRHSFLTEATSIEYRANASASTEFNNLAGTVSRMQYNASFTLEFDWWSPISGTSKAIGAGVASMDLGEGVHRYIKGFGINVVERNNGTLYAKVENGHAAKINGWKYDFSNARYSPQVFKYIDGKVAAKSALTDFKSLCTKFTYLTTGIETYEHFYENLEKGKSTNHIVAEATVDISYGLGSAAAAAWTGAAVGGAIGGPVGLLIGAAVWFIAGFGISMVTDGIIINGQSISDHTKSWLEDVLDSVFVQSEEHAHSSLFH